jgi:hypothetical protein
MFDRKKFCKVMDDSGLSKRELTLLYGVTRQTLYMWRESPPHQHTLADRAEKYTDALSAAISKGVLPFPASVTPERRAEFLLKIAQRLHTLTAPK